MGLISISLAQIITAQDWIGWIIGPTIVITGFAVYGYLKSRGVLFRGESVSPLDVANQKIKMLEEQRDQQAQFFAWMEEREDKLIERVTKTIDAGSADLRTFVQNATGPVSNRQAELNQALAEVLAEVRTTNKAIGEMAVTVGKMEVEMNHMKDDVTELKSKK